MRSKIAIFLLLTFSLLLCACEQSQGQKNGVVDLNRLMRDSAPGKAGLAFIEAQQKELQTKLDSLQDKLEKNPADEAAMQELQTVYAASQQRIQAEGQHVVTLLFDAIQNVLNNFREKNGYAMLIRAEALDAYDPGLDVTNAVMAEVDKLKIDFQPVTPKDATPAAQTNPDSSAQKPAETPQEKP